MVQIFRPAVGYEFSWISTDHLMTKMQYNSALQWLQSAGIETQSSKFALCCLNLQYNRQHNRLTHSANCKSKHQLTQMWLSYHSPPWHRRSCECGNNTWPWKVWSNNPKLLSKTSHSLHQANGNCSVVMEMAQQSSLLVTFKDGLFCVREGCPSYPTRAAHKGGKQESFLEPSRYRGAPWRPAINMFILI